MMSYVFRDSILFRLLEKMLVLKVVVITLESTYMSAQVFLSLEILKHYLFSHFLCYVSGGNYCFSLAWSVGGVSVLPLS